ncbi:MAG TPA: enoyl-CoA hydratase-related protein [Candidatus Limnocylindrales bacterium]|nr:enoyl-CoA hydratase-related protein [Candidatus Limnocylindrales bacterium]
MAEQDGKPRIRVELPASHPHAGAPVEGVALITLDRPEVLNALDSETMRQLVEALERLDAEETCRCIVITGAGERAFAAGADIKEMADATPVSLTVANSFARWERIRRVRTPIVAAVRGYALGGGCELAMACDMIVAADDAVFGQPEIRIGVIPGAGGTQRLTRALGKAKAMELILTGRNLPAREAEAHGLVTRLVAAEETLAAAVDLAAEVAALPPLAVMAAKEAINRAFELSLEAGLEFERRNFFLLFASEDQREGMRAFVEKRPPKWTGR